MYFKVNGYEYTSMRKLNTYQLPDIHMVYETDTYGHVKGMYASLVHDGQHWYWVPHENTDFKVQPIPVKLDTFYISNE